MRSPIPRRIALIPIVLSLAVSTLSARQVRDAAVAYAHTQDARRFRAGLSAGIVASQVDGDGFSGYTSLNATAGIWVDQPFTPRWAWRIDIRYIGKGSVLYGKIGGVSHRLYQLALHYIELPVSATYQLSGPIWGRLAVGGGLSLGILLAGRERNAYGEIPLRGPRLPARYDLAARALLALRFTPRWALRAEASFSFLPLRGKPVEVIAPGLTGQFHRLITASIEYAF